MKYLILFLFLTSCAMIQPYEPQYEQLSAVEMQRAYKDYRQACKRGETDQKFLDWLNYTGDEVYPEGGVYTENDTIIEGDTLIYWIKE